MKLRARCTIHMKAGTYKPGEIFEARLFDKAGIEDLAQRGAVEIIADEPTPKPTPKLKASPRRPEVKE